MEKQTKELSGFSMATMGVKERNSNKTVCYSDRSVLPLGHIYINKLYCFNYRGIVKAVQLSNPQCACSYIGIKVLYSIPIWEGE